jgi:hypothetical protein
MTTPRRWKKLRRTASRWSPLRWNLPDWNLPEWNLPAWRLPRGNVRHQHFLGWDPYHYSFHAVWEVPAPPAETYRALSRAEDYPRWWREIRWVRYLDEHSAAVGIRSLLPIELALVLRSTREDPQAGVLEAAVGGDLEGYCRWTVTTRGDGASVVLFEEEVVVRRPLMRHLAIPARPAFRANHALMMRSGRNGLRHHLRSGSGHWY